MKIYKSMSETVGNTPLVELGRYAALHGLANAPLAKLECFNPAGSAKDRVAMYMIAEAEKAGLLSPGATIIETTSGNTGIGLAAVAAERGYKVILTMPDTMSIERRRLLAAYGAEIVLTDGKKGMLGATEKAEELAATIPGSFTAGQFYNPSNPKAHYETTGPEIWNDTDGNVDIFVAGVGTGGTLTGVGRYLKEKNRNIEVVAVEPFTSPLLSKGVAGPHGLQGIGANFVPDNLDKTLIDEIIAVKDEEAFAASKEIARSEGYLVGISSGAAAFAARCLAARPENADKKIVALLNDTGERYLSTGIFD